VAKPLRLTCLIVIALTGCDNPIEKKVRDQLSGPIRQNTQYAIDDVVKLIKPGVECMWFLRDAEKLRGNADNVLVRDELKRLRERAKQAGCLRDAG
jgi:hypothetical protein